MKWPLFLTFPRGPDFTVYNDTGVYLRRWWVIPRNVQFNIYLHNFVQSDDDRALHDHPWKNISIVLRGSYVEHMAGGVQRLRLPWRPWFFWRVYGRPATKAHTVQLIDGRQVWSLFLTGPVVRQWGFHCPKGWVFWKDFVEARPGGNAKGVGCGENDA